MCLEAVILWQTLLESFFPSVVIWLYGIVFSWRTGLGFGSTVEAWRDSGSVRGSGRCGAREECTREKRNLEIVTTFHRLTVYTDCERWPNKWWPMRATSSAKLKTLFLTLQDTARLTRFVFFEPTDGLQTCDLDLTSLGVTVTGYLPTALCRIKFSKHQKNHSTLDFVASV